MRPGTRPVGSGQQALDSYCYANGVRRMAYPSIAASGPNSIFLHWDRNDRLIEDGDVVLNDSGAEYGYYATDITRTYPANGRFSPEQRAIYEIVLAAQKAAMAEVRPGVPHERVGQAAARVSGGLVRPGFQCSHALVRATATACARSTGSRMGRVGRPTRPDATRRDRGAEPGMCYHRAGIYVPATPRGRQQVWNIGVRVRTWGS